MAVTSINLARVSFNLRAYNLLESIRANQRALYDVQTGLATGLKFQRPSEDPVHATAALKFDRRLERIGQVRENVQRADQVLTEVDTSMQESMELIKQAQALAVQATGDTLAPDERRALVTVVSSVLDQLISVGNRKFLNTYLYAGEQTTAPFLRAQGGVYYRGDGNRLETVVELDGAQQAFTVPGLEFFGAVSGEVHGAVDLDPRLTLDTRLEDLNGAAGRGVVLGALRVQIGGQEATIDLRGCATVGDVIDRLNVELPGGLQAVLGVRGINLSSGGGGIGIVTVSEVDGGRTAADLGLLGSGAGGARAGDDVDPRLTSRSHLSDLLAGSGVDAASSFVIHNGDARAVISLAGVVTVEDLLNRVNAADVGVWGRIADDARVLEIRNRVSGIELRIEENGGTIATVLGLRSLHAGTPLAALDDGRGLTTGPGPELRITARDGSVIDVDLDGATVLGDVIDRINAAGSGLIAAGLAATGNGLVITDSTGGAGPLTVADGNDLNAAHILGLDEAASGERILGRDANPIRVDSPFTALLELAAGMEADDRQQISAAAERLERVVRDMQVVQGRMAAQAQAMAERADRIETEKTATEIMLSDVRDVELADVAVRFQQLQLALQANFSTASQVLRLSVLDYLR